MQTLQTKILAGLPLAPIADVNDELQVQNGLRLINRHRAGPFAVHPTKAGHRATADAFNAVIQ